MGFHATNLIKPSLKLWINQIKAIFLKKFYSTRRNLLILGFIFFIPFLFTVIALVTEVLSKDQIIPPPLLITTSSYKRLNILLHNVHFADNGWYKINFPGKLKKAIIPKSYSFQNFQSIRRIRQPGKRENIKCRYQTRKLYFEIGEDNLSKISA